VTTARSTWPWQRLNEANASSHETLATLLDALELDASRERIDAMLSEMAELDQRARDHGTSASAAASVGRWQHDLSPALKEACQQAFGPALETFGYVESTAV
jgi:hypothetical protein